MQNQIIYNVQQPKTSLIQRICSCLYFIKNKTPEQNTYQLGIDSPKGTFTASRKYLVLDLDETLVHSQFQIVDGYDFELNIVVQGVMFKVYVTIRPGAEQFIEVLSEYYDIILWTASLKEYADPVMDYIDPNKRAIRRMYRDSCTQIKQGLTKNLMRLNKDLKDVIIVDNSSISFQLQPENAYQIRDFFQDKQDRDLEMLVPFFIWLSQQHDVRPVTANFQYYQNNPQSACQSKKASFIMSPQQMDFQYIQYEEQQALARQNRKVDQKSEIISQSLTINNKGFHQNAAHRVLTIQVASSDYDDCDPDSMRQRVGLNSPVGEIEMKIPEQQQQDQTDDDEKDTSELNQ